MRQSLHRGPPRQRGIAVITAMLVVALATILAADLAWELQLDIRRSESALLHNQAREFALGAEIMAADALRKDYEKDTEDGEYCDHQDESWNTDLELPFERGTVRGRLRDVQGRFNLNELAPTGRKDKDAYAQFERLLGTLGIDTGLAGKVLDWVDPDQSEVLGGAEDGAYTSRKPPYRTANTWFTTTTELLAIDGMLDPEDPDDEQFRLLERYVTALPPGQKINVNLAEDPVLISMSENGSNSAGEALRANRPYCSLLTGSGGNAFMDDAEGLVDPNFANKYLDVTTNFFQLKVLVTLGTVQLTMYSLLHRDLNGIVTTSLRFFDTK
jgi:general secretion pathway protein K